MPLASTETAQEFSPPHVIILNGVGSVGKSSTAQAIQMITAKPFLHVAMDSFIDMLPERMIGHPEGLILETAQTQGRPSVIIKTSPYVERVMRGHALRYCIHGRAR